MIAHIDRNSFSLIKLENCHLCHTKNTKPWIKIFPKRWEFVTRWFLALTPWCNMISNKTLYIPQNTLLCISAGLTAMLFCLGIDTEVLIWIWWGARNKLRSWLFRPLGLSKGTVSDPWKWWKSLPLSHTALTVLLPPYRLGLCSSLNYWTG